MYANQLFRSYETSWNDRYLFEPIGPSLGRKNIVTDDSDKVQNDIYKQQSQETTLNSFLGTTKEYSYSSSTNGFSSNQEMRKDSRKASNANVSSQNGSRKASYNGQDSRKVSYNGQDSRKVSYDGEEKSRRASSYSSGYDSRKSSLMNNQIQESSYNNQMIDSNRKASYTYNNLLFDNNEDDEFINGGYDMDNGNGYTKSSSYSASYQKTSVNGKANESSSFNEQHYDSRDGRITHGSSSSRKSSLANDKRQSRRESRKSSG